MNRLPLAIVLLLGNAAACVPRTPYNGGSDIVYRRSVGARTGPNLVSSAIELRSEADERIVRAAGGSHIGELRFVGVTVASTDLEARADVGTLAGTVALEAGGFGATHFYATASRITPAPSLPRRGTAWTTRIRYALYRVEPAVWGRLPTAIQPHDPNDGSRRMD